MGVEDYDKNLYYEWLLQEAEVAWNNLVPEHSRTTVGSTPEGQATMLRTLCSGSHQVPLEVDIVERGANQIIRGFCAGTCGAGLVWDIGVQEWQVNDGKSG